MTLWIWSWWDGTVILIKVIRYVRTCLRSIFVQMRSTFFKQTSLPSFSVFWFVLQSVLKVLELYLFWMKLNWKMLLRAIPSQILMIIWVHRTSRTLPSNSLLKCLQYSPQKQAFFSPIWSYWAASLTCRHLLRDSSERKKRKRRASNCLSGKECFSMST